MNIVRGEGEGRQKRKKETMEAWYDYMGLEVVRRERTMK